MPSKPQPLPTIDDPEHTPDPNRWIILFGLLTATIMQVMDTSIVNVALPQMCGNLGATTDEIGWVSTSYILANVVVLPLTAWLALRFGRKRYLATSTVIFIAASVLCGASQSLGEIVFARILQGAGGAALMSTAQATLFEIFPRRESSKVQALFGMGIVVAPTLAPTLGGYIVDNYTWPWVFFVNVPIGLVSIWVVTRYLKESVHKTAAGSVDWVGIGFMTVGLGSLQYILEEGNRYDWFNDVWITRLAVISAITLAIFVYWELHPSNPAPAVNLRVMKDRSLGAGLIIAMTLGFGLYGSLFIYPMFAQTILGFTATTTGLVLLPRGVATGAATMICGPLLDKGTNPRTLIATGMLIVIFSFWQLSQLTSTSGEAETRIALMICGFGMGFLFIPVTIASLSHLRGAAISQGSALFNFTRQLGGSIGIAVISTYITRMGDFHRSDLVSNFYRGSHQLQVRQAGIAQMLYQHDFSRHAASAASMGIMNFSVRTQSAVMAYNDAFLLLGIAFAVSFPTLLLMKGGRRSPVSPAAAE
jgi:DHA2 family multidrug resistance protein